MSLSGWTKSVQWRALCGSSLVMHLVLMTVSVKVPGAWPTADRNSALFGPNRCEVVVIMVVGLGMRLSTLT